MAKKHIFKSGDIFALEIDKTMYFIGRVLLNIEKDCIKSGLITESSPLSTCYSASSLSFIIDMFEEVQNQPQNVNNNKCLYSGVNVSNRGQKTGKWIYVGSEKIDPRIVEFPEVISYKIGRGFHFTKGEIHIPLEGEWDEIRSKNDVMPTLVNSVGIKYNCLYQLGYKSKIQDVYPGIDVDTGFSKIGGDLRYVPELRAKVYDIIGEDPNQSYYEMSLKHGYDIGRFFK